VHADENAVEIHASQEIPPCLWSVIAKPSDPEEVVESHSECSKVHEDSTNLVTHDIFIIQYQEGQLKNIG